MPSSVEIVGTEIQHLRGYSSARITFAPRLVLVGPNNSGKTSLGHLLDFVFRGDLAAVAGERSLTVDERSTLLPSRDSRGRARRLTLLVRVHNRRRHNRFHCVDGVARLKVTVTGDRCSLTVSPPRRGSQPTEPSARVLLEELRESYEFIWIPAGLSAGTSEITDALSSGFIDAMSERLATQHQQGTTWEYRTAKTASDAAAKAARDLARNFADQVIETLDTQLVHSITGEPNLSVGSTAEWLARQVDFRLVTGEHDAWGVAPDQVGSGLQALLYLALRKRRRHDGRMLMSIIEEPETHLHPALQRLVARDLLSVGDDGSCIIVSTHAPGIVSEARYGDTVLVKQRQFYPPSESDDVQRSQINSALMEGRAAEAFFADSVLLVEGAGDFRFFETLGRRLAHECECFAAEHLFVLEVGSNTRFGPWIRLFRSYGEEGNRPIEWLIVTDGDSTGELPTGLVAGGFTVPMETRAVLNRLGSRGWSDVDQRREDAKSATSSLLGADLRAVILPVDMEWEICDGARTATRRRISELIGADGISKQHIARALGSKVGTGSQPENAKKGPWLRSEIATRITSADLTPVMRQLLTSWLAGALGGDKEAAQDVIQRL